MSLFIKDNLFNNSNFYLESGGENLQFPLANLKHPFSNKIFKSINSSCVIKIDLGAIKQIDFISFRVYSSTSPLNSVTFRYSNSYSSGYSVSQAIPFSTKQNIGFIYTPISCRFVELTFSSNTNVELSNICVAKAIRLLSNDISTDLKYSKQTNNSITKNKYGQKFIDIYSKQKTISATIKLCNASEFDSINSIHEDLGENYPLWFILDESSKLSITDSKFLFSGMFYMKDLNWSYVTNGYWDCNIDLEECL